MRSAPTHPRGCEPGELKMDFLPVFLNVRERPAVVVGGGAVALRKAELLLRCGARVTHAATGVPSRVPGGMMSPSMCVGTESASSRSVAHVPVRQSSICVVVALVNSTPACPDSQ